MSILNKVNVASPKAVMSESAKAAQVLVESKLAKACPKTMAMLESADDSKKALGVKMAQILENTAIAHRHAWNASSLFTEDVAANVTSQFSGLNNVAALTPSVLSIVDIFYPNMCLQYIADIQTIDRKTGEIFVLKAKYSDTRAGVQAGDEIFRNLTDGTYATFLAGTYAEQVANNASDQINFTLTVTEGVVLGTNNVIEPGSAKVFKDGELVAMDNGKGGLFGSALVDAAESKVDYATGAITVKLAEAGEDNVGTWTATVALDDVNYGSDYKDGAHLIPHVEFEVGTTTVVAKEHPLVGSVSKASEMILNSHLNLRADEIVKDIMAGLVGQERDIIGIQSAFAAARYEEGLNFNTETNGTNLSMKQRFESFSVNVAQARVAIQNYTKRGGLDFIIVGAQAAAIVPNVEGYQAAPGATKGQVGSYLMGTLDNGEVAVIFAVGGIIPDDAIVFGFKGFQTGDSALVVAEFVPLYFTPLFQAPHLVNSQGCLSMYDAFVNNKDYLVKAKVVNG